MSEQKQPTHADLERVAKWLGPEWCAIPFGDQVLEYVEPDFHGDASQWDVTGAIFDAFVRDGLEPNIEHNFMEVYRLDSEMYRFVVEASADCKHAAALACAVKYLEGE